MVFESFSEMGFCKHSSQYEFALQWHLNTIMDRKEQKQLSVNVLENSCEEIFPENFREHFGVYLLAIRLISGKKDPMTENILSVIYIYMFLPSGVLTKVLVDISALWHTSHLVKDICSRIAKSLIASTCSDHATLKIMSLSKYQCFRNTV